MAGSADLEDVIMVPSICTVSSSFLVMPFCASEAAADLARALSFCFRRKYCIFLRSLASCSEIWPISLEWLGISHSFVMVSFYL